MADHREANGKVDIIQRFLDKITEVTTELTEEINSIHPRANQLKSKRFQIENLTQAKKIYELRNYDAIEDCLYTLFEVILR